MLLRIKKKKKKKRERKQQKSEQASGPVEQKGRLVSFVQLNAACARKQVDCGGSFVKKKKQQKHERKRKRKKEKRTDPLVEKGG